MFFWSFLSLSSGQEIALLTESDGSLPCLENHLLLQILLASCNQRSLHSVEMMFVAIHPHSFFSLV